MWNRNARTDADAGRRVRDNWSGTDVVLARDRARGGKLASRVGRDGSAHPAGDARLSSGRTRRFDFAVGGLAVAQVTRERPPARVDVGLWLRDAHRAYAIRQCVICSHRLRLVSL